VHSGSDRVLIKQVQHCGVTQTLDSTFCGAEAATLQMRCKLYLSGDITFSDSHFPLKCLNKRIMTGILCFKCNLAIAELIAWCNIMQQHLVLRLETVTFKSYYKFQQVFDQRLYSLT